MSPTWESGRNPAWGSVNDFYVVHLPEATKENRDLDRITGTTAGIKRIDRGGWEDG